MAFSFFLHSIFILVVVLLEEPNLIFSFVGIIVTEVLPVGSLIVQAYSESIRRRSEPTSNSGQSVDMQKQRKNTGTKSDYSSPQDGNSSVYSEKQGDSNRHPEMDLSPTTPRREREGSNAIRKDVSFADQAQLKGEN